MNYQSFLQTAQQGYRDTLSGYATALSGMQAQQASINEGYNQLQRNVLGGLEGSSAAESQAIADRYAAMSGSMQQSLISRGLGNTTVQGSMQRGITLDESKAQTDLRNKFANTAAGYQSSLGLAALGYRGNALQQQQALQMAQLGYMGSYAQQQNQLGLGFASLEQQASNARMGRGGGGGSSGGGSNKAIPPPNRTTNNYYPDIPYNGWGSTGGGGGGGYDPGAIPNDFWGAPAATPVAPADTNFYPPINSYPDPYGWYSGEPDSYGNVYGQ